MKIVTCRACQTPRVQGDPCNSAFCPRNLRAPAQRSIRTSAASNVQTSLLNPGVHFVTLSSGPRLFANERYVADVDGTHFIGRF